MSAGVLCVHGRDRSQLQPGLIEADRPVFKSVQCQVTFKPKACWPHTTSEDASFPTVAGLGVQCWDQEACVRRAHRWTEPVQSQQVEGTPGGSWIGPRWGLTGCRAAWGTQHTLTAGIWDSV